MEYGRYKLNKIDWLDIKRYNLYLLNQKFTIKITVLGIYYYTFFVCIHNRIFSRERVDANTSSDASSRPQIAVHNIRKVLP